ncbi:MAG: CRISPR-associated endoribonuclease Cas6 [Caldilineaceae bacterium]|nr:CRISPR-associated endoribonuclease Cas6 [Caldilineaceae bacterium]
MSTPQPHPNPTVLIAPHPLHALVLKLLAEDRGALPGAVGELAHAAFYATIDAVDPTLAGQMHDAQTRKAFSLSPLYGYRQSARDGRIYVDRGEEGWLRLTLLDPQIFMVFTRHLLSSFRPSIRLGNLRFAITEVLGSPGSHPWVDYTTLQALQQMNETQTQWALEFASPTAFHWGDADNGRRRVELFPAPKMTLAGLRTRWDRLTGENWGLDFEAWVERNVVVGRIWRWETQPVFYKKQTYTGGCGELEYRLLDDSHPAYAAHLNRLLHFAFYTGVGYKTTHGMGQVRLR